MELRFLGRGSGFNPVEGSNSSYFIDKGELFLIDCGESIFHTIMEQKILDSVSKINLLITHTHSDHVGSLGSLILYAFAIKKINVALLIDENMGYLSNLRLLLVIYGLAENMYHFAETSDYDGKYSLFTKIRFVKTRHCNELESCGILFQTKKGLVFYSGDINDPEPIKDLIKSGRRIDKIYVDTNNDRQQNPHHISLHQLDKIIPPELKSKVYCMHIKNEKCIKEAKTCGFKVVSGLTD